jgi:hypothetical protein
MHPTPGRGSIADHIETPVGIGTMDEQSNRPVPPQTIEALDASVRDVAEGHVVDARAVQSEARRMLADHERAPPVGRYLGTIRRYLMATTRRPARPQAARRLIEAYEAAVGLIESGPRISFSHPRPYPELVSFGFRWIKVHRYWFGYLTSKYPIITNILDEVADIPAHLSGDRDPIGTA